MNKKYEPDNEQAQTIYNMDAADLQRLDDILKRINAAVYQCAMLGWTKNSIHLLSSLEVMYELMRPVANKDKQVTFDSYFYKINKRIYEQGKVDYVTYSLLKELYRALMILRQHLGYGIRSEKIGDYTDEFSKKS